MPDWETNQQPSPLTHTFHCPSRLYLRAPCSRRGRHYCLISIIFSAGTPKPRPGVHFSPSCSFITQPPAVLRYLQPLFLPLSLSSTLLSRSYITPALLISPPIIAFCSPVSHYVHSQSPVSGSPLLHFSFIKSGFLARLDGHSR